MRLPERFLAEIEIAHKILGESTSWIRFKKILLTSLPSIMRKSFSTRDPKTKIQRLNQFECNLIDIYKDKTGVRLKLED